MVTHNSNPSLQFVYTIRVQMLEIYNETLRDLFRSPGPQTVKLELLNTQVSQERFMTFLCMHIFPRLLKTGIQHPCSDCHQQNLS